MRHRPEPSSLFASRPPAFHLFVFLILFAFVIPGFCFRGQKPAASPAISVPSSSCDTPHALPQDQGVNGLKLELLRLRTTGRMMYADAHPDDEDGGLLTLESRGRGVTSLLMTLNRGEGGQNRLGSNLFDVLGVLRTLELLASDDYYGSAQRFSRVADFGFSKTADETFAKWGGHDVPLADMVQVIRSFHPDVIASRFQGSPRDGHGNHQAAGILSREAFRVAADPKRFPQQMREGLQPWQPKKLYTDGFGSRQDYSISIDTGVDDPLLGMTYAQFARKGLMHQLSQGAGSWGELPAGPRPTFYKLADSVIPSIPPGTKEKDLFEGIDTTLTGLGAKLGIEDSQAPFLRPGMTQMEKHVDQATAAMAKQPGDAASPLLEGLQLTKQLIDSTINSSLSAEQKAALLANLDTKQCEFQRAANLALGLNFEIMVDAPVAPNADDAFKAVPGQSFTVTAIATNHSGHTIEPTNIVVSAPPDWKVTRMSGDLHPLAANQQATARFRITVPADAQYTRPYWHRDDPETDAVNKIDNPRYVTLPLPPPALQGHVSYKLGQLAGTETGVVQVKFKGTASEERSTPLAVAPPVSVALEPSTQVIPTSHQGAIGASVIVHNNLEAAADPLLTLQVPTGWRLEPPQQHVRFTKIDNTTFTFKVFPARLTESRTQLKADLNQHGKNYTEGYTVVTRDDLRVFYYYQPAIQKVSAVDVRRPANLQIGYVMGAGDEIPTVLKQLGLNVTSIPAADLKTTDLSRYGTIILGINAYTTPPEVKQNNDRLLEYVKNGGTLVVQYNQNPEDFNKDHLTPYPAELSHDRVSVEEAPVEILAPQDPIFHYPNQINQRDFQAWVQERGLYFMQSWDSHFQPLLSSNDPGEPPQKGGLLRAQYGKGTYIYTGYAFFRQLPAGVPGAVRLFVNIISAGHETK
jgi:LmbE family N-acetylglucosaminyl deacetylase